MADFSALIAQIEAYVKQNGNNEITGNGLQDILVGMVNALGTVAITALQRDLEDEETARTNADSAINAKIPAEASSSNKLADKAFVTGLTTSLQNAVNAIKANIDNGYVYAGIATPSGTPVTGKVFYIATAAGTYTNFGSLIVTRGINILKYNGSVWSKEQLLAIDGWMSRKATRLYKAAISLAYNDGEIAATITPTAESPFLYFELGYTGLASTTKQATLTVVDGINYIYYSASDQNLHLTSNVGETLEGGILLEAFYAYQGTPLFAAWTSAFVTKTGFGTDYNASCVYMNPKQFAELTKDVRDLQKSHNKLTRLVGCSISLTSSSGSIAAALTLAQGHSEGYVYHERGYFTQGASASAQLSLSSNGVYIIYYDATAYTIKITNDLSQMSESCVILEVFYAYDGAPTYCCWTSPSVVKVNFPAWYTDSFSSYSNNRDIEKALSVFPYSDKTFRRVGCIGDSYTAGRIYTSDGRGVDCEKFSWPHYLQNITGNVYSNFGVSGSTAKGWMSGAAKLSEVQAAGNKCQAYIIGLMINDRSEASWNLYYTPVGVIGDIGTNNDTYYAWYYKLVQAIRAVNTSAPIFCNTCPKYAADDAYNQAVRDIVNYCHTRSQKVYLNDLASAKYKNERYFLNQDFVADEVYGHYTAIGYEFMAESLMRIISDTVNDYQAEFTGIHLIPYDDTDIKCDGVFDISVNNPTDGQPTPYVDLQAALGTNGANVPVGIRKGGMSVKFIKGSVQSSDNKYVQYRLMADTWSTNTDDWAIADEGFYVENREFVRVYTDLDDKILWAIKANGDIYYGTGVPTQVKDYIQSKISELSLSEYDDIVTFLGELINGDTLATLLNEKANAAETNAALDNKVDKITGKSLINVDFASSQEAVENPEWMNVTTDKDGKVLGGRAKNGTYKEFVGIETEELVSRKKTTLNDVHIKGDVSYDEIPEQIKGYVEDEIGEAVQIANVDEINHVKRLGTPIALMNYNHVYPSGEQDAKYNYLSVLRKEPSMVYLYYGVTPRNGDILNDNYLRMAYCDLSNGNITDPNNWNRTLPQNLTKTPSQKWQEWYNQQTIIPVTFDTDVATTRMNIPENQRYEGMFISYNNGSENIVERYGYKTPPEGKTWNDTITETDTRTWNDIFESDNYWTTIKNAYENNNYVYFEDLYGEPLLNCYGGTTIKVPDVEYPYRSFQLAGMPIFKASAVKHILICMWKSKDAVVFEQCKFIDITYKGTGPEDEQFTKDGTVDAILHGNIIRLYTRWRPHPSNYRQIGEEYVDLDGNLLAPGHHLFGEDHLYTQGVSRLDDRRDILFPTWLNSGMTAESIKCYIRDGNRINEIQLPDDFSENGTILQQYIATNGIVTIQENESVAQYIIYEANTFLHDRGPHWSGFDYNSNYAYIKIREIKLDVQQ